MTDEDRKAAAEAAGLDPKHAHRLNGSTAEELEADAKELAAMFADAPPKNMSEWMRSRPTGTQTGVGTQPVAAGDRVLPLLGKDDLPPLDSAGMDDWMRGRESR